MKWEYSIRVLPVYWEDASEMFDEMGDAGWNLVTVQQNPGTQQLVAFFKREKEYATNKD